MALNLNNVMLGSADSKKLAEFYAKVLGDANPDWSDETNGWFGWQVGAGTIAIGPHSEIEGRSKEPARVMLTFETDDVKAEFDRIRDLGAEVVAEPYEPGGGAGMTLCTFADPDGNYFQLSTPMGPEST
jgi:predicted enzyme related to lactoylglutathione lyase